MSARAVLLGLVLSVAGLAPAPDDTVRLEADMSSREKRLASLWADYWRAQYRIALGEKDASTLKFRAEIREVLTASGFPETLAQVRFAEPLVERRRQLFLEEAADARIAGDPELAALTEDLEKTYAAARFSVGGKQI